MIEQKSAVVVNRLFGVRAIKELAANSKCTSLKEIEPLLQMSRSVDMSVRDAFAWAQGELGANYRSEYFYKSVIIEKIVRGTHSPNTMAVYSEFKVGSSRADLVLINGQAVVYEIKTDMDDLSKAGRQAAEYYSCFKRVVFVVDEKHIETSLRHLPEQVGISSIGARNRIRTIRKEVPRSDLLSNRSMFSCMHRREYESMVSIVAPKEINKQSYAQILNFIDGMSTEELYALFVQALRTRKLQSKRIKDMHLLPASLWAAAYSHKLKEMEWNGLIKVLDKDVKEFI